MGDHRVLKTAESCRSPTARLDILPALKREDSFVRSFETASPFRDDGRPKVSRTTSGRSVSPRRQLPHRVVSTGFVRYTSALEPRVWCIQRPRWTRYPLVPYPIPLDRSVRIPGTHPRLERGQTRVVPSTVLRRQERSATANGACFGMLSPPRLRGRCRPSPVTGRGSVRAANESQPRTPHRVCQ